MATESPAKKKTVLTCGTFDVLHIGHLRMLQRCKALGTELIVGVSSDALNYSKKQKNPVFSENHRMELVGALRFVDKVFLEESLEEKRKYCIDYNADLFVIGDDWEGKFDHLKDICEVQYLERTPSISTTEIVEQIRS
jgi:glycerol-3-phosphate cytidylyltransferase